MRGGGGGERAAAGETGLGRLKCGRGGGDRGWAERQSVWRQRDQLEAAGMKHSHRTDFKLISE